MGNVTAADNQRAATLSGRAKHIFVERLADHRRVIDFFPRERGFTPSGRRQGAVAIGFLGNADQRFAGDTVIVHVTLNLHAEILGR